MKPIEPKKFEIGDKVKVSGPVVRNRKNQRGVVIDAVLGDFKVRVNNGPAIWFFPAEKDDNYSQEWIEKIPEYKWEDL